MFSFSSTSFRTFDFRVDGSFFSSVPSIGCGESSFWPEVPSSVAAADEEMMVTGGSFSLDSHESDFSILTSETSGTAVVLLRLVLVGVDDVVVVVDVGDDDAGDVAVVNVSFEMLVAVVVVVVVVVVVGIVSSGGMVAPDKKTS